MSEAPPPHDDEPNPYQSPQADDSPAAGEAPSGTFESLYIAVALGATLVGVAISPGVGILIGLVAIPVMIRSLLLFRGRERRGLATSRGKKVGFIASSTMAAIGIYLMLTAFFATWLFFGLYSGIVSVCGSGPRETPLNVTLFLLLGLGALLTGGWLSFKVIRTRWKEDVAGEDKAANRPPD